ncbi:Putative chitin binding peritrophin-a domain protein, partial [Gryllus bimaculatus]
MTKRQIFREQVLPQRGGKIPEEAFRVDRLALNRLNKDGIAVPDGVLLDARRRAQHHPRHNSDLERSVVLVTPDGRYAAPEGRLRPQRPLTVDSTYIIRPPIGSHHRPPPVVGRPLPGPPLHIPRSSSGGRRSRSTQPYQQAPTHKPHQQPQPSKPHQQPHQLQLYAPQHQGPATLPASLSALPPATSFQDSFNGLFPTAGLDDFDLLVAQLNARAEREAARIGPHSRLAAGMARADPGPAPWQHASAGRPRRRTRRRASSQTPLAA